MDAWTDKQLAMMKNGGNEKCQQYLESKGLNSKNMSIQQKYNTDTAKLYKEVLKARAEGRPEPTTLPKATPKKIPTSTTNGNKSISHGSNGIDNSSSSNCAPGRGDPNGMERLLGESDSEYIARQTRLREEARARMAAKFGNSRSMGGVGSNSGSMGGIGGGGMGSSSGGGSFDTTSITDTISSGFGSAAYGIGSAFSLARDSLNQSGVSEAGYGLWNNLSQSAKTMAERMTLPDDDGLGDLGRKVQNLGTGQTYGGFGSDDMVGRNNTNINSSNSHQSINGSTTRTNGISSKKTTHLSGEDPNGIAALTGESDQEYMERQIRIRDEAKRRMEAKFGKNPSMQTVTSSNGFSNASGGGTGGSQRPATKVEVTKRLMEVKHQDDFFSSFGA